MFIGISKRESDYLIPYCKMIEHFGFSALVLDNNNVKTESKKCQGFILPGGEEFQEVDYLIIHEALQRDCPLLGICLGMQEISCYNNPRFRDDTSKIREDCEKHYSPNSNFSHTVDLMKNTKLYEIFHKDQLLVNSRHHYCISKKNHFIVAARTKDGIIEAIEIPNKKFILGVQWHPEAMLEDDVDQYRFLKFFFTYCQG